MPEIRGAPPSIMEENELRHRRLLTDNQSVG
jgi:hypothetical protein